MEVPTGGHAEVLKLQALVTDAAARLTRGDLTGYRALFDSARELDTVHSRYYASRLLLEQGFRVCRALSGRQLIPILTAMAAAAIDLLDENPAEPVLLNYAGVLFYELWELEAARSLFTAAQRLDPELDNVAANLTGVHERRRVQPRLRRALHPDVPKLSRRARHLAGLARPATGMRLSLCMIVKDEEAMLGRTLAAVAPAVDEIVVVDTGSSDRTAEIAHEYGALVIDHPWTGDFAAARNVSLEAATGDWILYLDADEVLVSEDVETLRRLRGHTWREAFFLHETNFTGREDDGVAVVHSAMRMLRNRPEYRFSGRLHEQIAHNLPSYLSERITQSPVRILHYGYLGVVRDSKEKSRRNIELLLRQREETTPTAFDHFNMGSEYVAVGELNAGIDEYERAWELVESTQTVHDFVPALISRTVRTLRAAGRHLDAISRADTGLERFPGFTDLVYEQGMAWLAMGEEDAAVKLMERCMAMGDAPSRYTALLGCGSYLPRLVLAERHLQRSEPEPALALLRHCAAHHGEFFGFYQAYARALMASGVSPADAVAEICADPGQVTPTVRFMIATALLAHGAAHEAAEQFGLVAARQPGNLPVLELWLESLLADRQFDAFSAALPRLHGSDLSARERGERLARMYLRQGYLRSAGREWIAVLERGPDVRALAGLAEVARRSGQNDAAHIFAAEALKLGGQVGDNQE